MDYEEIEKGKVHSLGEIVEYVPDGVVNKTVLKKPTGKIDIVSYDTGKGLTGKVYPFETFVLLLEGSAEIIIDKKVNEVHAFQGIVIPAHSTFTIKAIERFKMLSITVKSGYE